MRRSASAPARVPLRHVNTPRVRYDLYRIEPEQGPRLLSDYNAWQNFQPGAAARVKQGDLSLGGERNQEQIALLDLGRLDAGLYFLRIDGGVDQQIMVVSPYAMTI